MKIKHYIFLSIPRFHLMVQYLHVHLFLPPENIKKLTKNSLHTKIEMPSLSTLKLANMKEPVWGFFFCMRRIGLECFECSFVFLYSRASITQWKCSLKMFWQLTAARARLNNNNIVMWICMAFCQSKNWVIVCFYRWHEQRNNVGMLETGCWQGYWFTALLQMSFDYDTFEHMILKIILSPAFLWNHKGEINI